MRLSKAELIDRVNKRASDHYGGPISQIWLDDLIKDGLMPALDRGPNIGLAPQFYASARHLRRALQIKRLNHIGVRSRNAVLVQLFVRGYGVAPAIVGSALEAELASTLARLNRQLRSNYFEKDRTFGPKAEDIISRQLGPIDARLKHLEFPVETYVGFAREFRKPPRENQPELMTGALAPGSPLLKKARMASPQEIQFAGTMFAEVNHRYLRPQLKNAVINSPDFVAFLLGQFLLMSEDGFPFEKMIDMVRGHDGFSDLLTDYVARTPRKE